MQTLHFLGDRNSYFQNYRRQDTKNRQNSIDDLRPSLLIQKFQMSDMKTLFDSSMALYQQMLEAWSGKGMCKNGASTLYVPTKIYMTGSCQLMGSLY